ncbi:MULTISPECIES: hypothetical protein [Enterococcus]|uniref:Ricin B lectin domain-containing protein n=1 Tax=Enterococcus mundtii TaxID=53346 RepID=A0A2S7RNN4_ENTMU|nr:hypothetical protein [Enterococcus mundtii]MDA9461402.1 hypothetical protein [Enterococcus mundtii 3F]PQF20794.1 hypothetical protein CUS89_14300 [Enterococcus mundtii]
MKVMSKLLLGAVVGVSLFAGGNSVAAGSIDDGTDHGGVFDNIPVYVKSYEDKSYALTWSKVANMDEVSMQKTTNDDSQKWVMKYDKATNTYKLQTYSQYFTSTGMQYGYLHSSSGFDVNSDRIVGAIPSSKPVEAQQWKIRHLGMVSGKGNVYRLINNHEQRVLSHRGTLLGDNNYLVTQEFNDASYQTFILTSAR